MDKVVAKLDRIFSVQDIMTPAEELKRAGSIEEARQLFSKYDYDVVPYPKMGKITGFFQRGLNKPSNLKQDCLISDTTGLLDMPQLLHQSSFYFIIFANKVTGYVHYSDLNKPAMKVPLFVLIQAMEKKLWDKIAPRIDDNIVRDVFKGDAQRFIEKRSAAKSGNVDIGWIGVFTLPNILRLANKFGETNLVGTQIKLLGSTRNKVSHADRNLIGARGDVPKLVEALKLCHSVIMNKSA